MRGRLRAPSLQGRRISVRANAGVPKEAQTQKLFGQVLKRGEGESRDPRQSGEKRKKKDSKGSKE